MRLVQQPLSTRWNQPVVIDNRPGANAIIATEAVAKAKPKPDGYTLLMAYATELALNPVTVKNLPYDPAVQGLGAGFVQAGRLRALAVTSPQRSPQMPEVPSGNIQAE